MLIVMPLFGTSLSFCFFFFQAEDGIRDVAVTGVQTCALPISEVNQILGTLAPSFNASHQTIADGSDHINPASLRGLGPDQVLVLVNGKRRHPPALVHVNGTFGRGTVGVDLNAIPRSEEHTSELQSRLH